MKGRPIALTGPQMRFIELMLAGNEPKAADVYIAAIGGKKITRETARRQACNWLRDPRIKEAIERGRALIVEDVRLEAAAIRQFYERALITDRNEIAQVKRGCCRYCWGAENLYHETAAERAARKRAHDNLLRATPEKQWERVPPFDDLGGTGYNPNREINPACPECWGEGEVRVLLQDTTKLGPGGMAIFEGVDFKDGRIVLKTFSKGDAAQALGKMHGMFTDKFLGIIAQADATQPGEVPKLPDDPLEAAQMYQRLIKGA